MRGRANQRGVAAGADRREARQRVVALHVLRQAALIAAAVRAGDQLRRRPRRRRRRRASRPASPSRSLRREHCPPPRRGWAATTPRGRPRGRPPRARPACRRRPGSPRGARAPRYTSSTTTTSAAASARPRSSCGVRGARVQVRLEDGHEAPRLQRARSGERRRDLGRRGGRSRRTRARRRARPSARSGGRRAGSTRARRAARTGSCPAARTAPIAASALSTLCSPGTGSADVGDVLAVDDEREPHSRAGGAHVARAQRRACGERPNSHAGGDARRPPTRRPCPPGRTLPRNSSNAASHLELGRVGRVVVELDVREHGDVRAEVQERAIGLVGLDDHPLPAAPDGVRPVAAAGQRQLRADRVAGVLAARRQRVRVIAVVVVLPCVPATAITRRSAAAAASSSPRWWHGRRARARPRPRGGRRGSPWRRPAPRPAARARRRGRPAARCRPRAARRSTASRPRRSRVTSAPSACAISASPLMPGAADADEVQLAARPRRAQPARCARRPAADSTSAAIARRRRVARRARAACGHLRQPVRVAEQLPPPPRAAARHPARRRRSPPPRPRPPSTARSWPGGRRSRAGTGSGSPAGPRRRSRTPSRPPARPPGRRRRADRPASRGTRAPW